MCRTYSNKTQEDYKKVNHRKKNLKPYNRARTKSGKACN